MISRQMEEPNAGKWLSAKRPRRVLMIRLQAIGDVVLCFPLIQALKNEYPGVEIDFLTRHQQAALSKNLLAIDRVFSLTNSQQTWWQLLHIACLLPLFFWRKYAVIIDLQGNKASRILSKILGQAARAAFDRKGIEPAIVRYQQAVEASALKIDNPHPNLHLRNPKAGNHLLLQNEWDGRSEIVVLNPGGFFKSRNWPIENYVAFAKQWLGIAPKTQFLIMGDERIANKAGILKQQLGKSLINLYQQTTLEEAFCILSQVQLIISEDSGLLWMAWVQKVPAIALFGSTPGARMNMGGAHARFLTSSDLPCGDCFLADCKFGETALCLSRYTPGGMIALAQTLLGPSLSPQGIN
jgi:ADP-heptose:LPS heptosyltransferase